MLSDKDIISAIPQSLLATAIAAIGPSKPKIRIVMGEDGGTKREVVLDELGAPVMQPGGFSDLATVEAAFDDIKDKKHPPVKMNMAHTYATLTRLIDFKTADAFNTSIDLAISADDLPQFLGDSLNGDGVPLDSTLEQSLRDLIGQHGFTLEMIDTVFLADIEVKLVFPGLKLGRVQNVIQYRARGII